MPKKNKKEEEIELAVEEILPFGTDDLYLAAYLVVKGVKLTGFDPANPFRVVFIFEDSPERLTIMEEFLLGRGSVEPKYYAATMKDLKRLTKKGQNIGRYEH